MSQSKPHRKKGLIPLLILIGLGFILFSFWDIHMAEPLSEEEKPLLEKVGKYQIRERILSEEGFVDTANPKDKIELLVRSQQEASSVDGYATMSDVEKYAVYLTKLVLNSKSSSMNELELRSRILQKVLRYKAEEENNKLN